jgi:hypothetical protein
MNLITTKNNTVVTLHLDDKERGRKQLAPYNELHGDNTLGLHLVGPHAVKRKVGLHKLVVLPSKLLEDIIQDQIDDSAAIDEHPRDQLPVDVAPDVQWLQVLARFLWILEHSLLGVETHLSDLLIHASELDQQRESTPC